MLKKYRITALISLNFLLICLLVYVISNNTFYNKAQVKAEYKNGQGLLIDELFLNIEEKSIFLPTNTEFLDSETILSLLNLEPGKKSKLDGKALPGNIENEIPITVMIENHPASRPQQSGLENASIVFEALAEGGITRFMAIFKPEHISKIGPVRSARPNFVTWAEEFGGVYVHAGGSDDALAQIAQSNKIYTISENLDEFWRDYDYAKPHNLFTKGELILNKIKNKEYISSINDSYLTYKDEEEHNENNQSIVLDFSFDSYEVEYKYDNKNNHYSRYLAGKEHLNLTPKNVIILFMIYYPYDEEGRLAYNLTGEGNAWYFIDGKKIKGKWIKTSKKQKTEFVDTNGNTIEFNPGQTWIEVINSKKKVTVNYEPL